MATINFKQFNVYTDITQENVQAVDVSCVIADQIYKNVTGIAAHDLAFRIYRSENEVTLSEEELELIRKIAQQFFTPIFIDSLENNINK